MSLRTREDVIYYAILIGIGSMIYIAWRFTDITPEKLILAALIVPLSLVVLTASLYFRIGPPNRPNND